MAKSRDELATTPLSAALTAAMRELSAGKRGTHPEIWARWRDIVGPEMYARSFPVSLRKGVLTIGVASSSWLQELSFLKNALLDRLAEEVGPGVVAEVKLVLDPSLAAAPRPGSAPERPVPETEPPPLAVEPELRAAVEELPDADLRAAVEKAMAAGLEALAKRNRRH